MTSVCVCCRAITGLLTAADSSGPQVLNGCFPTLRVSRAEVCYRMSVDGRGTHLVLGGRVLLSRMAPDFGADCERRGILNGSHYYCRIHGISTSGWSSETWDIHQQLVNDL